MHFIEFSSIFQRKDMDLLDLKILAALQVWDEPKLTSYFRRSSPIRGCQWKKLSKMHPILNRNITANCQVIS